MLIKSSIFFFMLFFLFACSNKGDAVISVGKKKINEKELKILYENYKDSVDVKSISKASFISQLVERIILEEESKKIGVKLSEEEIKNFLKENNIDEKKIEMAKLYLLRSKFVEKLVENINIDEQLISETEKSILDVQPEKYIFYQIVLRKREEALKVFEEIRSGLDFAKAAEKYSISPEKSRGGLIDYLNADEIPTELLTHLKKMKKDDISGVIPTPFGFHIVKLKEYIPKSVIDKKLKREKALEEAKKVMKGNVYAHWIDNKKKEYGVKIKWELVEKLQ